MATYSITGYKNTGYNGDNYPDSPSQLAQFATVDLSSMDLVQNVGLQTIRVASTFDDIKTVDYVQVGDRYYKAVVAPSGEAEDVWTVTLQYDPITTNGGPSTFEYADGTTIRHTTADDDMFEYTEADPYCTPAQPLEVVNGGMKLNGSDVLAVAVESSIDLVDLGSQFDNSGNLVDGKGISFTVGDNTVVTPYTKAVDTETTYAVYQGSTVEGGTRSPGTQTFIVTARTTDSEGNVSYASSETIQRALGVCRSLAIEGSILNQIVYPTEFIEAEGFTTGAALTSIGGKDQTVDSGVALDPYGATIKNNRLKYGEYNKYGLMTAKGDRGEYLPEQIAESGDTSPIIRSVADPRPNGRPYFRFQKYLSDESFEGFWMSCLQGLEWQNAPLVYTSASGSYMSNINFQNSQTNAAEAREWQHTQYAINQANQYAQAAISAGGAAVQLVDPMTWLIGRGGSTIIDTALNAAQTVSNLTINKGNEQYQQALYERSRQNDIQNQAYSQSVVKPDIMFPFNANVIRDFVGNGVLVYRYKYTDADAQRIDVLLTMYGYKDTRRLTADMFNARTYFDYVQATGVTVANKDIPMWERDLIGSILNGGIRVWHTAPDPAIYTTGNPVKAIETTETT